MFVPPTINSEDEIRQYIIANYSPPIVPPAELDRAVDRLLQLYPDIPALGSPFGTGDETFHLPSSFKRISALGKDLTSLKLYFPSHTHFQLVIFGSSRSGDSGNRQPRRRASRVGDIYLHILIHSFTHPSSEVSSYPRLSYPLAWYSIPWYSCSLGRSNICIRSAK